MISGNHEKENEIQKDAVRPKQDKYQTPISVLSTVISFQKKCFRILKPEIVRGLRRHLKWEYKLSAII